MGDTYLVPPISFTVNVICLTGSIAVPSFKGSATTSKVKYRGLRGGWARWCELIAVVRPTVFWRFNRNRSGAVVAATPEVTCVHSTAPQRWWHLHDDNVDAPLNVWKGVYRSLKLPCSLVITAALCERGFD